MAGGKNPTLTQLAIDGSTVTPDSAVEAQVASIRHWATARRDNCFDHTITCKTPWTMQARRKLANNKGMWWSVVAGPTTALVVSLRRIGWKCYTAITLITDEVQTLDLELDPPVAVATAAKEAI